MAHIKTISNSLAAIGDPVSTRELFDVILEGLPSDYESLVNLVNMTNRMNLTSVDELGSLLLAQEARIEKNRKLISNVSVNLTQSNFVHNSGMNSGDNQPPPKVNNGGNDLLVTILEVVSMAIEVVAPVDVVVGVVVVVDLCNVKFVLNLDIPLICVTTGSIQIMFLSNSISILQINGIIPILIHSL